MKLIDIMGTKWDKQIAQSHYYYYYYRTSTTTTPPTTPTIGILLVSWRKQRVLFDGQCTKSKQISPFSSSIPASKSNIVVFMLPLAAATWMGVLFLSSWQRWHRWGWWD